MRKKDLWTEKEFEKVRKREKREREKVIRKKWETEKVCEIV